MRYIWGTNYEVDAMQFWGLDSYRVSFRAPETVMDILKDKSKKMKCTRTDLILDAVMNSESRWEEMIDNRKLSKKKTAKKKVS